jgi:hypothetical protein
MGVFGLPGRDILRFDFAPGPSTPAGAPFGSLTVATSPFTQAASGQPIDLKGDHALQVVFRNMKLADEGGAPTFSGPRETVSDPGRSLRHVIMFDESEGQVGWYVGYDGSPCITATYEGTRLLLLMDFGVGS